MTPKTDSVKSGGSVWEIAPCGHDRIKGKPCVQGCDTPKPSTWHCNVCKAENDEMDGECQQCECAGDTCKRDNCSGAWCGQRESFPINGKE